jgi:hypothetical protein
MADPNMSQKQKPKNPQDDQGADNGSEGRNVSRPASDDRDDA